MQNLKQQIIEFFSNSRNRSLAYATFILLILAILSASVILILNPIKPPTQLSKEEQDTIIEEVVKNNPQTVLDQTVPSNTAQQLPPEAKDLGSPSATPDLSKYNYRLTKNVYKEGPASKLCTNASGGYNDSPRFSILNYSNDNYTLNTTEYFEKNRSFSKSVINSLDSGLMQYTLSEYSSAKSESYDYRGGDFAILAQYEAYPGYVGTDSVDTPVSYNNVYSNSSYYEFIGTEKINGKDHYKIKSSYVTFCNRTGGYAYLVRPGDTIPPDAVTIITITYVDTINFNISRTETYLNAIASSNLMSSNESTTTTALTTYNDVQKEFSFNYSVPVRTLDYRGYWGLFNSAKQIENAKTYLINENITVLTTNNYVVSNISVPNSVPKLNNSDYIQERSFYPSGEIGDKYFTFLTQPSGYLPAEVNINTYRNEFYNIYKNANISIYEDSITKSNVIDSLLTGEYTSYTTNSTQFVIDQQIYSATRLSIVYSYYTLTSYPLVSYPIQSWTNTYYVFEANGRTYMVSSSDDIAGLSFTSYRSNVQSELNNFISQIKGYGYIYPNSYTSYPVSYNF